MEELESVLQVTDGIEILRLQKVILEIKPKMFVQAVSTSKLVRIKKGTTERLQLQQKQSNNRVDQPLTLPQRECTKIDWETIATHR